ncbi:hypothetical protein [Spirosoma oryzicola]|uniref:hypothetical protein n=1 Tax=Spirosoma oryzicola TaxID=2898794 RepID=UPI001E3CE56B|nr:hypothetical protein [Spirosoma oryzicola]UHG93338.1 hypothetical protein LQ777_10640 [Spirosoma oryzicola]
MHGDEKALSAVKASTSLGSHEWVAWGKDDNEPNQVIALNWESPSKPSLMDQAKEFILGAGVAPFRETYEGGKVVYQREAFPEIKEWFEENEIFDKYLELAALSMTFCEQAFVNLSVGEGKDIGLQTIQPLKCRYVKPTGKGLEALLISPQFGTGKKPSQLAKVPLFNRKEPTKYAESIMHLKKAQIGQDFYNLGLFWGTKWWTKVANKIPLYHLNGLENGYNIKYLIEIDEAYFIQEGETPGDEETDKLIEARKDKFMAKLDAFLAGVENADKAVVMIGDLTNGDGKANDLIRIKPVDNKMTDDAYTKIYGAANTAQAQGHGILPVLAGIAQGEKLGGSGSELEHAAMYQVAYRTPSYRRHLLKPLNLALKLMGLDEKGTVAFRFVDIEFTTLDKNPTGKQNSLGA